MRLLISTLTALMLFATPVVAGDWVARTFFMTRHGWRFDNQLPFALRKARISIDRY